MDLRLSVLRPVSCAVFLLSRRLTRSLDALEKKWAAHVSGNMFKTALGQNTKVQGADPPRFALPLSQGTVGSAGSASKLSGQVAAIQATLPKQQHPMPPESVRPSDHMPEYWTLHSHDGLRVVNA